MLFHTYISLFLLLITKYYILKSVGNQTVADVELKKLNTVAVNGYRRLFGYQHSSKYIILWRKELIQFWNNMRVNQLFKLLGELSL